MKHPATQVQCPLCAARPGAPCTRPSGHTLWAGTVHAGRRDRAREYGYLPPLAEPAKDHPPTQDGPPPGQLTLLDNPHD